MTTPAEPQPTPPTAEDLRSVIDDLMTRFATLPDDVWEQPAHESDWTCREAASHIRGIWAALPEWLQEKLIAQANEDMAEDEDTDDAACDDERVTRRVG